MTAKTPVLPLSDSLRSGLNRLRGLNDQNIQHTWQVCDQDMTASDVFKDFHKIQQWPTAQLDERQHIAWDKGLNVIWLSQVVTVPAAQNGYPLTGLILRLSLTWWAEDAQIYVNGQLIQSGDLFECFTRICLSNAVTAGQSFKVAIRLVSPKHDNGALVRSHLTYELPPSEPTPEPSFVADELTVLAHLEPTSQPTIEAELNQLSWNSLLSQTKTPDTQNNALSLWSNLTASTAVIPATVHPFQQSLSQLRRNLNSFSTALKQRSIQCIGHAHLDMAWLWPISDTWNAAERTFKSVLALQNDFPELTYTHSSPALFEWLETNRPQLFEKIQAKVREGSWSIDAGLWIEPEFNIVSGEAIARHILYGQRYCQKKFGHISTVAWLPDSFGFCWQLPQLLRLGEIETFATLKLSWNDTTEFPHQLFWWEAPDGTRILSIMLPPIGSDIDPAKMADFASKWEESTGHANSLWLPGMGDHGGGPTRDMLEKARRWKDSPFFPTLSFTHIAPYLKSLPISAPSSTSAANTHPQAISVLPVWKDELYLELHRGCYTTHADQKRQNRRCEDLLYQAEIFATIAQITADQAYPKSDLDTAWKKLLFNQFHDILPGTSIPDVFTEANQAWQYVQKIGSQILERSIRAIASTIELPAPPHPNAKIITIFNSLSWSRSSLITITLPETFPNTHWQVYDSTQNAISCQQHTIESSDTTSHTLSFIAQDLPSVGYRRFWLVPCDHRDTYALPRDYTLENNFIKANISPETGEITSLKEKTTQLETLTSPGNKLQAFIDKGQYWDAWNIDPAYQQHPLLSPQLTSIEWLEYGPVFQKLRVTYTFQKSTIHQDYSLDAATPFLQINTHIDWQETQILLKANFPLPTKVETATYEIPFGAISRPTQPANEAEAAKWEVPALRWADVDLSSSTDHPFGLSLLTDCKHGFDASPDHIRLTLIKSPIWPDPTSDKGHHYFTYAIYPHLGTWQSAHTTHHARALNIRPTVHWHPHTPSTPSAQQTYSLARSFLEISNPNLILSALKPSEENPKAIIIRCYEAHGQSANLNVKDTLNVQKIELGSTVNLLENYIPSQDPTHIQPWQIKTYQLETHQ
ncbi:MAG: alpha-mannosidase [Cyanobacteria bacterium J06623_4]